MVRHLRAGPWSPLLLLVASSAVIVTVSCLIPSDMERYWLAFAGEWTLAHGRILETLAGSWYPNRSWVDQEWLVAVATAWSQSHGVYVLMELLFAACLVVGVTFVAYESVRTRTHPLIACAQVAVASIGSVFFAQDRAQTLVWALLPALIIAWRRAPWGAVPILAVWANVHGSFPIAVLWMLLHLDRRRIAPFAVATLATLANPLGWHLWTFTLELAGNGRLAGYVSEWTPTLASFTGFIVVLLALGPLWLRLAAGLRMRRPERYGNLLFIAASALGTILAVRYSMLLFLTTATTLGATFRTTAKPLPFATRLAALVFSAIVLLLGVRSIASSPRIDVAACAPLVRGERVFTDAFPFGSVIELAGGYANVDGRIDAFPLAAIADSVHVLRRSSDAASVVRRSGAQVLALAGAFEPSPRAWRFAGSCSDLRIYALR